MADTPETVATSEPAPAATTTTTPATAATPVTGDTVSAKAQIATEAAKLPNCIRSGFVKYAEANDFSTAVKTLQSVIDALRLKTSLRVVVLAPLNASGVLDYSTLVGAMYAADIAESMFVTEFNAACVAK